MNQSKIGRQTLGGLVLLLLSTAVVQAQLGTLLEPYSNPSPGENDRFGYSVAAIGNNILVGAPRDSTLAEESGAAYLFDRTGNLLRTFQSPTADAGDWFGSSVASAGENILIGAIRDDTKAFDAGAAYLFDKSGNLLNSYFSPDPQPIGSFGSSLASVGPNIAIGAYRSSGSSGVLESGSAYIFDQGGAFVSSLENPTPESSDLFGYSMASVGDKVVVSAMGDSSTVAGAGAAYVFDSSGNLTASILNPTPGRFDNFGISLSAVGNRVVIGANLDDTAGENAGAAYVFDLDGTLRQTLLNPTPSPSDQFGTSVAGLGDNIIVGAYSAKQGPLKVGKALLFGADGELKHTFKNPEAGYNDQFGFSLTVVGNSVVIGSPLSNSDARDSGLIHLFEGILPPMLPGDADLDGDVDAADFGALKKFFSVGNTLGHGDFDGDGRVDLSDFQTIKQHFGQTLPSSGQVPEPSTWILAALGALGLLFNRARRLR